MIVAANAGDNARPFPLQRQRIGDVARRAAKVFAKPVHQKTDVNIIQLAGQEMVAEVPPKAHNAVISHRTGNQNLHRQNTFPCK